MLAPMVVIDFQELQRRIQREPSGFVANATAFRARITGGNLEPARQRLLDAFGAS
jgi:hypothetical protein